MSPPSEGKRAPPRRPRRGWPAALPALLLACLPAAAGVVPQPPGATTPPATVPRHVEGGADIVVAEPGAATPPHARTSSAVANVKCFQEGRLIFESNGLVPMHDSELVLTLSAAGQKDGSVQILDLRQGLCIVESRPGRIPP